MRGFKFVNIDISADGVNVYGTVQKMPDSGDIDDCICQNCLTDTKKTVVGEVIQFGIIDDRHYLAMMCNKCKTHWVVVFTLEHNTYGANDETITVKGN